MLPKEGLEYCNLTLTGLTEMVMALDVKNKKL
jgi:hypothetical protein